MALVERTGANSAAEGNFGEAPVLSLALECGKEGGADANTLAVRMHVEQADLTVHVDGTNPEQTGLSFRNEDVHVGVMQPALEAWLRRVVQPAAQRFGVVEVVIDAQTSDRSTVDLDCANGVLGSCFADQKIGHA